ncbi:MAG: hypothetical protein ACT4OP_11800 [Actinomycetota bacterium]
MNRLSAAFLVVALIAACGESQTITPTPGATTPANVTTTSAVVSAEEFFAFVVAIDETTLTFDRAEVLTGAEAQAAAEAAGETLETDFYINNPDQTTETAQLDEAGAYRLIAFDRYGGLTERTVDRLAFVDVLNGADQDQFYGIVPGNTPMTLQVAGDVVVGATQVYFP